MSNAGLLPSRLTRHAPLHTYTRRNTKVGKARTHSIGSTDSGTRGMPSAVEAIQGSADGEDILTGPA